MLRNGHKILKIETHVLKVNINCKGCEQKVRKLLKKIEGVYSAQVITERQVVIVLGSVDSATVIKKLAKSGKSAELWSTSSRHELNQETANMNENQIQFIANNLASPRKQYIFPVSFGNEIQDMGSFENYFNQNSGMKAMNARTDQDLMEATGIGNMYWNDDNFAGHGRLENDLVMMDHAYHHGNDSGFVGIEDQEFNWMTTYEHNNLP